MIRIYGDCQEGYKSICLIRMMIVRHGLFPIASFIGREDVRGKPTSFDPKEPLRVNVLFQHIQEMLSSETEVIAETGDSWFNCQKLKLHKGCGYEFQMQYGSIGWSVGATLEYAQAARNKRVMACIGDGSFQIYGIDATSGASISALYISLGDHVFDLCAAPGMWMTLGAERV